MSFPSLFRETIMLRKEQFYVFCFIDKVKNALMFLLEMYGWFREAYVQKFMKSNENVHVYSSRLKEVAQREQSNETEMKTVQGESQLHHHIISLFIPPPYFTTYLSSSIC